MTDTTFKVGDLVWARMKGYPPWPARVSPSKGNKKPVTKQKNVHWIYFFGSNNYAWIEEENLKHYHEFKDKITNNTSRKYLNSLKEAVEDIENFIKNGEIFEDGATEEDPEALFDKLKDESMDSSSGTPTEKKTPKIKPKKDTPRNKRSETGGSVGRPPKKQRTDSNSSGGPRLGSISPALNHSTPLNRKSRSLLDRPANVTRPDTPPLDVETLTPTLKEKNIKPSDLKFGFLGLGIMGRGMVKNLLNSGHKVIVWNRTQTKCNDFVKAGADEALTPSDVVAVSDITFSCVSDPQVAKDLVFGNCGVLTEMSSEKAFVEMTGIDAETSQDIAEAITSKGGKYLEAQIQGSKTEAEEGTLVILAAGDMTVFDNCRSCFSAMGKNSFFLGDVGTAAKMNLVVQLIAGVTLAGLTEGMALAERAGLQQKDLLEILKLTSLACPAILKKGQAILENLWNPHHALRHMQKDLHLSLGMSDQLEQPLALAAAANEAYKHAKRLGYGEYDASAVYLRAKF